MANQDRVNFVWAESALTTIPPIPVSEVAYRDTTQTPEQMEVGQQYDTIYNSARHNQLLFLLTSVAKTLCENGIMPFLAGQEYSQYARCIFTDGKLYTASRAILANEQPYPTPGDDSGVWIAEETSENLVPNSRRVIAGTGLTGGGPLSADVTLAAKLTDSVSSTDSTTAASAKAVKTAYDLANSKQANLGFTPVQQGGGTGQDNSKIYIGGSPEGLRVQMGATDLGNIVTTRVGITKAISATTADTANGIGTHPWFDSLDPGGNPPWVIGLATDGSNKLRPFDPAVLRVSYAASAGIADMRVYATQTFSSVTSFTLPAGGSWLVIATNAGVSGGFVGVYAGGTTVTSEVQLLANCIQIASKVHRQALRDLPEQLGFRIKMDYSHIIHRIFDDSYVITKNGMPYHVYPYAAEFAEEWDAVFAYAEAHPECVTEEQLYVPPVPTQEDLAARVRAERDRRIAETDYLVMSDYPLSQEKLEEIKVYRQALRDLPQQPGFPWGGPDDPECTWPSLKH